MITVSENDFGILSTIILGLRTGDTQKCNFCEEKTYEYKTHTNARYDILFIKTVTIALFDLRFDDTTMRNIF